MSNITMFDTVEEAQAVLLGGLWHRLESKFDISVLCRTKILESQIKWTDTLKNQAAFPHDIKSWMIAKALDNEIGLTFSEEEIIDMIAEAYLFLTSPLAIPTSEN